MDESTEAQQSPGLRPRGPRGNIDGVVLVNGYAQQR